MSKLAFLSIMLDLGAWDASDAPRPAALVLVVTGAPVALVVATCGVAIFDRDTAQADRAHKILQELLNFLRAVLTSGRR